MIDLGSVTKEYFGDLVGGVFSLETVPGVKLELVKVVPWGARLEGYQRDPFTLEFRGPAKLILPQGCHRLTHPDTGAFELFLVQTGGGSEGSSLEAVFS